MAGADGAVGRPLEIAAGGPDDSPARGATV
jgi:hypothetical protein